MNIIRMFAFAAAVLITALLFGAIAEGSTSEQPIHAATAVHGTAAPGWPVISHVTEAADSATRITSIASIFY